MSTEILCEYNCGNLVRYTFKNGRKCCSKHATQCPTNRRKKMHGNPFDNHELFLCKFGCTQIAKFRSANGTICCSSSPNQCPAKAKAAGLSIKAAFNKLDNETGKTVGELRLEKSKQRQDIRRYTKDPVTGLTGIELSKQKAAITKQKLLPTGLTVQQQATQNMSIAKKGNITSRIGSQKGAAKKKITIDPVSGLTVQELATQRQSITMSQIGVDGLSGWERAQKKSQFRGFKIMYYKNFSIYYQGSHEKEFLDLQYSIYGDDLINHVIRPAAITYKDPTRGEYIRTYFPDFIIDNIILYEIKSQWTWNNNKAGSDIELRNIAKLNAAKALGYEVRLILDHTEIVW